MTFDRNIERKDEIGTSHPRKMNFLDYSELVNAESLERELQRVRAAAVSKIISILPQRYDQFLSVSTNSSRLSGSRA
jgi:hypothetical protein